MIVHEDGPGSVQTCLRTRLPQCGFHRLNPGSTRV
jgi:hypothetical protein